MWGVEFYVILQETSCCGSVESWEQGNSELILMCSSAPVKDCYDTGLILNCDRTTCLYDKVSLEGKNLLFPKLSQRLNRFGFTTTRTVTMCYFKAKRHRITNVPFRQGRARIITQPQSYIKMAVWDLVPHGETYVIGGWNLTALSTSSTWNAASDCHPPGSCCHDNTIKHSHLKGSLRSLGTRVQLQHACTLGWGDTQSPTHRAAFYLRRCRGLAWRESPDCRRINVKLNNAGF